MYINIGHEIGHESRYVYGGKNNTFQVSQVLFIMIGRIEINKHSFHVKHPNVIMLPCKVKARPHRSTYSTKPYMYTAKIGSTINFFDLLSNLWKHFLNPNRFIVEYNAYT